MRRAARAVEWLALGLVGAALVAAVLWRVDGGRWERVETASMGTAAPVDTVLWVRPVAFDDLRVGDIVTVRVPDRAGTVSHRIRTVHDDGTLTTQGDLAEPDPWRLGPDAVVGRVEWRWRGVGWFVACAPALLGGALVVGLLVRFGARGRWKVPVAIVGAALVVSLVLVVQRPLVDAQQLSQVGEAGGARATYVATGLLPVSVTSPSGDFVSLRPGETGAVLSTEVDQHGAYPVSIGPHLSASWWAALVLVCFLPALCTSVARMRRPPP